VFFADFVSLWSKLPVTSQASTPHLDVRDDARDDVADGRPATIHRIASVTPIEIGR
jgi:hypothetical protein